MIATQLTDSPAGEVLMVLQRRGSATVKELEEALGVTANAVRQQIANLLAEGYIEMRVERSGRGRPRHLYSLTARGRALFPRHYDEFTNSLLQEMLVTEGPEKVQSLFGRLGRRLAEQYARQIAEKTPAERAKALTEILNAKGILAEVRFDPDGIVFQEYTCPYYELAREHRSICDMEEGMIAQVIQQPVALVQCTLDGHHGCQFKITETVTADNGSA